MYKIAPYHYESFCQAFEKLQKLAVKLNSEVPTFTSKLIHKEDVSYYEVVTEGIAPKYDGWTFVARIDLMENIITGVEEFPIHYHENNGKCEHCNANHRRVKTYIIRKENEYMEVGGACLKNYTGGRSPDQLARYFALIDSFADFGNSEESYGSGRREVSNIKKFIKICKKLKNRLGFVRSREDAFSTSYIAFGWLTGTLGREMAQDIAEVLKATEVDDDYAEKALAYTESLPSTSSFIINLKQICNNGFITERSAATLAAIVQVYDNHVDSEIRRKLEAEQNLSSEHQGKLKDRLTIDVTVTLSRVSEGMYGPTTWLVLRDSNGNVYTWSASKFIEVETGDKMKLIGTVKDHKLYNDIKQTVLTRCKILD